jgi:hypothetical protein
MAPIPGGGSDVIALEMRGALERKYVEGDFAELANTLNLAAAKGQQYIVLTPRGGGSNSSLVNTQLIITAEEVDEDAIAGF